MDYLERAERIAKGFELHSKLKGDELMAKEISNFDAIAAYSLMSIASALEKIVRQNNSTSIAINAIAMRLDPEFDPNDYTEEK